MRGLNPFAQGEDQLALSESLRRLLQETNAFERRRARLSAAQPDRMALWPRLADQGVIAVLLDEAHGGFAGDPRTLAVIMSELGAALAVEPLLSAAVMPSRIWRHAADAEAAQAQVDSTIAGELVCVLAHPMAGEPFAEPPLRLRRADGALRLDGHVPGVAHADTAQSFLLPALDESGDVRFLQLPRSQPGLTVQVYRSIDAAGAGDLRATQAPVESAALLRLTAPGRAVLDDSLQWGILGLAAETAGIAQTLNVITFEYLMTRKQFGSVIGSFQALRHRAADMWIALQELIAIMQLAIHEMASEAGESRRKILCAAKYMADRTARRVGNEAVQMHGGMGVSDELIVSHYFRRLAALRRSLGDEDAHKRLFGEST